MQKEAENGNEQGKKQKRTVIIISVVAIVCLVAVCVLADQVLLCRFRGCIRPQVAGGGMCVIHTCEYPDCHHSKSADEIYCMVHEFLRCDVWYCDNFAESDYHYFCKEHECAEPSCKREKGIMSDYCSLHD